MRSLSLNMEAAGNWAEGCRLTMSDLGNDVIKIGVARLEEKGSSDVDVNQRSVISLLA